ncbi:high-affinity glucose transporter Hxt2p [[Candida] jaroonii]|uniref:High-affinity glucose transporter Hxt2p n=1 Tax=[Candida] jaroonii TaxID=467808 RepID=A0ACA9YE90_9ASCO|nr:high-affinity glucose transporter Hxt2p [[Candida] jaroonii]
MSEFEEKDKASDNSLDIPMIVEDEDITPYLPKFDKPWYKYSHFLKLYFYVFLITITSSNNGFDSSIINVFQSLETWKSSMGSWFSDNTKLGSISNAVVFGTVAAFPFGFISDKWGRKIAIYCGQSILVVGVIIQAAGDSGPVFLVGRLIIGLGMGMALVGSPSLISEIAYPTHRPIATGFYNTCWYLGAVIAAWVTYGTRNISSSASWRVPSGLQAALPLFQLALIWMCPESPRFLVSKGKIEKARKVLRQCHIGDSQDPHNLEFIEFELRQIERAIELEKLSSTTSYMDFLKIPSHRKRLFLTMFTAFVMQFAGNGLVSYYLNKVLDSIGITGETKQLQINGCLMIYNTVISMAAAAFVGGLKRRSVLIFSFSGMLVVFIIWTILSALCAQQGYPKSLSNGVLAMIFFFYAFFNIGLNGLPYVYITEVLPYSHRAKGLNIFQLTQMSVIIFNGYVNPIGLSNSGWKYYIVYVCAIAFELTIIYFFYPETSGYTLEEVAKVFGDGVDQADLSLAKAKAELDHKEHPEQDV